MATINKVTATGLKCGDFSHELRPVNVIVGKNFAGKTSRIDAIRVALMGYLPELGKTPAATFSLANNCRLDVSIETDAGFAKRSWRQERGSVKHSSETDLPATPAVLMDPAEYFNLSERERVKYVFGLINMEEGEFSGESISAAIRNMKLDENNEQTEKAIQALVRIVDESDFERHDQGQSIQEWIDSLITNFKERLKTAKANAERMAKLVQGLTQLKASEDDSDIQNVDGQLSELREQLSDLKSQQAVLVSEISRLQNEATERKRLKDTIEKAVDHSDAIAAKERELTELQRLTADYVSGTTKASTLYFDYKSKHDAIERDISRNLREIAERSAQHDREMAEQRCPKCKTEGHIWKPAVEAEFHEFKKRKTEETQDLIRQRDLTKSLMEQAEVDYKAAQVKDDTNTANCRSAQRTAESLRQLRAEQAAFENAKMRLNALGEQDESALQTKQIEIEQVRSRISGLTTQIQDLEGRQRRQIAAKQDEARHAQALLEHAEITAEVAVTKEAVKTLEATQAKMVETAFKSILDRANQVTSGILKHPLEYRDGEIGWFEGSTWVRHKTFSGSEKALAYAGISAALAADAPVKIVMIDELGRLEESNRVALVMRMLELTDSGTIDQFIGADTDQSLYAKVSERINVINVSK